jgi:hypothetical protein
MFSLNKLLQLTVAPKGYIMMVGLFIEQEYYYKSLEKKPSYANKTLTSNFTKMKQLLRSHHVGCFQ